MEFNYWHYASIFSAGAVGALVHLLVGSNRLVLPSKDGTWFTLGVLGPILVGGFVGLIAGAGLKESALFGYLGSTVLDFEVSKRGIGPISAKSKEFEEYAADCGEKTNR